MIAQDSKKLRIIRRILNIDDESTLDSIENHLGSIQGNDQVRPDINDAIKPIRSNVSLEQIKAEQGYKAITYEHFRELADQIEWGENESLEELLALLTK